MAKNDSSYSDSGEVSLYVDIIPPKAPSNVSATGLPEAIEVEWNNVTESQDGSSCGDLDEYRVYYASSSGIDPEDSATYTDYGEPTSNFFRHELSPGLTRYYVITAVDTSGNESLASSEVSATSQAVKASDLELDVSDYAQNINKVEVGDKMIGVVFEEPDPNWAGFSHYKLYYAVDSGRGFGTYSVLFTGNNPGYLHKNLVASNAYKYKLTLVDEKGNETTGTVKDNSGAGYTPDNTNNSNITDFLIVESLVATDEIRGDSIYAGSEIEIASSGKVYSGSSSYATGDGWWIGDDAGTPKFSIGDFTNNDAWMKWTGDALQIKGAIQAGSDIGDSGSLSGSELQGNLIRTASNIPYVAMWDASAATTGWDHGVYIYDDTRSRFAVDKEEIGGWESNGNKTFYLDFTTGQMRGWDSSGNNVFDISPGNYFWVYETLRVVDKNIYIQGGALQVLDRSSDPSTPNNGIFKLWLSDGTGSGDDGDIMVTITDSGGTTKTTTLVDFSTI